MRWSYNLERSPATAVWLFGVAGLVALMLVVGGATRLTGSGLSITEWRPVTGVLPPLSEAGWAAEFAKYQHIPQYRQVNLGMPLDAFKTLYWWEWGHRLLARLIGAAFLIAFAVLLFTRRLPRRLIWRCAAIFALGGLEATVGWWMVSSGLEANVLVAPERLATHLSIALLILVACVWTGLEALYGRSRTSGFPAPPALASAAAGLVVLVFVQSMLGALVAGNQAGRIFTDWPLMDGHWLPPAYALKGRDVWAVFAHSQAAVQFNHRMVGYLLLLSALALFAAMARSRAPGGAKRLALWVAAAVTLQAMLGVLTLRMAAPLALGLTHQFGAFCVLVLATLLAWRVRRS